MHIRTILSGIMWTATVALGVAASVEDNWRLALWCVLLACVGALVTGWQIMHHIVSEHTDKAVRKLNRGNRRTIESVAQEIADAMGEREDAPRRIR